MKVLYAVLNYIRKTIPSVDMQYCEKSDWSCCYITCDFFFPSLLENNLQIKSADVGVGWGNKVSGAEDMYG